ncbi:hypothetical protein CGSSp6BS73_06770 [Streptococcus pneumoniae SP6-BS73]|nr:hypothetical protein CGSSp6BS73_06770 [Streptococcus pneumoniae SP6-BS73]
MTSLNQDRLQFDITGVLGSAINWHIDFNSAGVEK